MAKVRMNKVVIIELDLEEEEARYIMKFCQNDLMSNGQEDREQRKVREGLFKTLKEVLE